jgi:hypothetical protein
VLHVDSGSQRAKRRSYLSAPLGVTFVGLVASGESTISSRRLGYVDLLALVDILVVRLTSKTQMLVPNLLSLRTYPVERYLSM